MSGITRIRSSDGSSTVANPTGPTTDLTAGANAFAPNDFPQINAGVLVKGQISQTLVGGDQPFLSSRLPTFFGAFGAQGALVSLPTLIEASSVVVDGDATLTVSISGLDTTGSALDIFADLLVTNLAATEAISVSATATIAQSGPAQSAAIDWTTATVSDPAGSDLSWNATTGVTSAAGGLFVASLAWQFVWP